jgi:hypothetical protein
MEMGLWGGDLQIAHGGGAASYVGSYWGDGAASNAGNFWELQPPVPWRNPSLGEALPWREPSSVLSQLWAQGKRGEMDTCRVMGGSGAAS